MQARKDAVKASIREELATQNAQELMNVRASSNFTDECITDHFSQKANEKCFEKCVTKPGTSLSSSEEVCCGFC